MTELLHTLGLTTDPLRAVLQLERGQLASSVELAGQSFGEYVGWKDGRSAMPRVAEELWLRDPGRTWWLQELPEERALYVQFNQVSRTGPAGEKLSTFAQRVVEAFERGGFERLVIDVRLNGGGDNTTFGPLVDALRDNEYINVPGRLYLLMGRATFSAAGNFVTVMQRDTEAILVGEPTGGSPNQYGDARTVVLPNHPEIGVRVATRYHVFGDPEGERLTHAPDLPLVPAAADYFAGRDPVLDAALKHSPVR